MTFDEFWAGSVLEGKTLNPIETKLACHLAWANAQLSERERCAKIAETLPFGDAEMDDGRSGRIATAIRNPKG